MSATGYQHRIDALVQDAIAKTWANRGREKLREMGDPGPYFALVPKWITLEEAMDRWPQNAPAGVEIVPALALGDHTPTGTYYTIERARVSGAR